MRPAYYREQWEQIKPSPSAEDLKSLSQRVASAFVDRYFYSDEYNQEYIQLLCEMATSNAEPELNQLAAKSLFGIVIERLCDDFEELQTETYNRLISQVAGYLRALPQGQQLDERLQRFHLHSEDQLYQRVEAMRLTPDSVLPADIEPRKILILSRVTIGADVAVTSVICQRLAQAFPQAELVVLGNDKLRQIMTPASGIRIRELHYARHGGLVERFNTWLDLVADVEAELQGLSANEYLVFDPDSRLTQLGVLPLVADRNYRFFNSRGKQGYPVKGSISALCNTWLNNVLGDNNFNYPRVWLNEACLNTAASLRQQLCQHPAHRLITLNLGVGGNQRKRVAGDFEADLVLSLLQESNTTVILDMGFGDEEQQRSTYILDAARKQGITTHTTAFDSLTQVPPHTALLGVECNVGEIGALISHSDEFIGYDSACQHIGAALGIPTYTIFAGTSNARFIRRWHASGPNTSEIVYVDTLSREHEIDTVELIQRLHELRRE
ncbi:MAG: glycosyltransferase family 9 protein [Pseudomonadales bacterium]|nr:glycosyltransferase family 9 protein [Pseudomonadales bacterium]